MTVHTVTLQILNQLEGAFYCFSSLHFIHSADKILLSSYFLQWQMNFKDGGLIFELESKLWLRFTQ